MKFDNQVAVVTGGASGICQATAEMLAAGGATVCIGDIASEKGEAVAASIRKKGQKAEFVHIDLTNYDSIKSFAATVLQRFGRVDILVNGAGWSKNTPFVETDDAFWDKVITLNFIGPMRLYINDRPGTTPHHTGNRGNDDCRERVYGSLGETV